MYAIRSYYVPFQLFDDVDVGQFFINAEAPNTYSLEDTARLADRMEEVIMGTLDEQDLKSLLTNVGVTFVNFNRVVFASNRIQLIVDLQPQAPQGFVERYVTPLVNLKFGEPEGTRERDAEAVINAVRKRLESFPGIQRLSYNFV